MKPADFGRPQKLNRLVVLGIVVILTPLLIVEARLIDGRQRRRKPTTAVKQKTVELYRSNCARCHGLEGRGDTPLGQQYETPDFADPDWWKENSEHNNRALSATVRNGKGNMPAFSSKLKPAEIALLVDYVRRFGNEGPQRKGN